MAGTVDHYMPQALGGTNERENLRWCCIECNGEKADMHPDEWEQRIPVRPQSPTKQQQKAALLSSIARRSLTNG
jgi:5-methylcytosine-specific restriction endonuclease McrA